MITYWFLIFKYCYKYIITMAVALPKLEEIGLSRNEAVVYTTLLELGETKTGAIVKKTGMHRVLIYDALDALIEKGVATFVIKENRKYFQATESEKLLGFLREKGEIAESLLPELKQMREKSKIQQQVVIYSGLRGLKTAFDNMLKELSPGGEYRILSSTNMRHVFGMKHYTNFQKRKRKKDVKSLLLYYNKFALEKGFAKNVFGSLKYTPIAYFPTDTCIYNDKVMIIIFDATPPFGVLITNKKTAEAYGRLFAGFWKSAEMIKNDLGPQYD